MVGLWTALGGDPQPTIQVGLAAGPMMQGVRASTDLGDLDLGSVLRAVHLAEDVRARALRVADVDLRDVTVACAQEASDSAVLEAVRHERLAETAREHGAWGG